MRPSVSRLLGAVSLPLCVAGLALLSSCSRHEAPAERTLNIYNWSDYIGEDTVANFEKETGIKVHYDTFDSNEALHAKLVAGHTGYDIVVPSSNWAAIQIKGKLLQKIDHSRIANWGNVDPYVLKGTEMIDPGNQYLAPWLWGVATVGINVDKVKAALGNLPMPENGWDLIFKPEYASRLESCGISLLDSGDEVFPAALNYLGLPAESNQRADYEAASRLLTKVRPYVSLFSSSGYINELAAGSLCVSLGWNGDLGLAAKRAREAGNGQTIKTLLPKAGAILFFDSMAIPADAEHLEEAYAWINYIYRPDVQAGLVNKVPYANPVRAADRYIRPDVLANKTVFIPADERDRLIPPEPLDSDIRRLRTRLYTRFKVGQ